MVISLSHILDTATPTAGGRTGLTIAPDGSLSDGAQGATYYYTSWNHAGSHVDAPAHVLPGGASIADLPIEAFIFRRPLLLDIPCGRSQLLYARDLQPHRRSLARCDLLLLRTGSGAGRTTDPRGYVEENPGLSAEAAAYLAGPQFSSLRALGIDAVSIAAARHLDDGVEAHRILLRKPAIHPFLIFEDLRLEGVSGRMRRVFAVPHLIRGLDSSPVTVIAEY